MRILIVDDEQLVRWFLERALKTLGYEVITAPNVRDAIKKLTDDNIDILFTDLKMPEENGAVLLQKLSVLTRPPKTVVCSAFITPDMEADFKRKGIYTLKKPFKLDELGSVLKEVHNQLLPT